MHIQISVMVWTVVCFSLTALILRFWLFGPVLELLDRRKAALAAARAKRSERDRLLREQEASLEALRAHRLEARADEARAAVARIEADSRTSLKNAQKECLEDIDAYRRRLLQDYERIIGTIDVRMDPAVETIAGKIISYRT